MDPKQWATNARKPRGPNTKPLGNKFRALQKFRTRARAKPGPGGRIRTNSSALETPWGKRNPGLYIYAQPAPTAGEMGVKCGADLLPAPFLFAASSRRPPLYPLALSREPGNHGCQIVLDAQEEVWGSYTGASEARLGEVPITHVCAFRTSPLPFGLSEPRGYPCEVEPGVEEMAPRGTRERRPWN